MQDTKTWSLMKIQKTDAINPINESEVDIQDATKLQRLPVKSEVGDVPGAQPQLYEWDTPSAPSGRANRNFKAWMTDKIGAKWFELIFLANCGEARPPLLILDSHSSHETFKLLDMAMKNDIYIPALPPHISYSL